MQFISVLENIKIEVSISVVKCSVVKCSEVL